MAALASIMLLPAEAAESTLDPGGSQPHTGDAPAPVPLGAPDIPAAPASPSAPTGSTVEAQPEAEGIGALVRRRLAMLSAEASDGDRADAAALSAFYEARHDEPLWVGANALTARATAVLEEIKKADAWGLDPKAFVLPEAKTGLLTPEEAADAEMKLSLAVLKYARHARGGRITDPAKQLSSYLDRMPQLLDPKVVLDEIVAAPEPDAALRRFHPQHPQFEKLRQRYLELKRSADEVQAAVKLPKGPNLIPGQAHAHVLLLRKRLGTPLLHSDGDGATDETVYDEALALAVKAFQSSKGLKPDGIVGASTRNALNGVAAPSPLRILANMEQWRWMPADLGDYHITVNIPEFMIRVVKGGHIIHEERVVTGTPSKQTPVFSAAMELVTIHPRWIVPDSIKVRELYPSLVQGSNSIARQGLRLTKNGRPIDPESVDWSTTDIRKFDVYQPSGSRNALGVVKLSFPNKHIVYFHDTPSKGLFNETTRAFSHGCIRVRNPVKLAALVLREDKGWDEAAVQALFDAEPEENPVTLDRKVPVHITYFTAWIDDEGKEQTAKDIYGHEKRITLALQGRFNEIERGPDHLAPVSSAELRTIQRQNQQSFSSFMNSLFGGF